MDGIDVSKLSRDERAEIRNTRIGFVFQGFNLLARTTARENVELPLFYAPTHLASREQRRRVDQALDLVGLRDRANHLPSQLSGGQQQRVAIARALVMQPALVLADEPTGNLDTHTSIEVMDTFRTLNDAGITVVMVTHELDIARYTKRTIIMRDGRVQADRLVPHRLDPAVELDRLAQEQRNAELV